MKDDTSTPTPDDSSPNAFESSKPGTEARNAAEAAIEALRQAGGVFVNAVRATRMPMVLTDPNLPGNPIVFANEAFLKLSGYSMEEVLGQEPHFMNGPATDPKDVARFQEVIRSDHDDIIETVQYRKDGRRFVATVLISAFKDAEGRTLNHFMSWLDVTRRVEAEDEVASLRDTQRGENEHGREREGELRTMTKLHDLGDKLLGTTDLHGALGDVLDSALEVVGSKRGTLQILDPKEGVLRYAATRSFDEKMLATVPPIQSDFHSTCAACIRTGERVVASDIASDPQWSDHAATAAALGYGAAFSTPMKTRRDELLGVITIHFEEPHTPSLTELRWLDLFARMAAHLIERARAEEALRRSEAKYRTLFDSMDEGYLLSEVIFNEAGKPVDILFLDANPAAVRLAGRDFTGQRMREIEPDYEEYWYEAYGRVALTGEPVRAEHYAEPHCRWFDFNLSRVGGPGSRQVASVFQDITDRKASEEALRSSEQRYRTLFESIDEGFCLVEYVDDPHRSLDFRFLEVNQAFERQSGLTGVVGKLNSEAAPDVADHWKETYAEVARTGVARRLENHHEPTDRWYDVFITRVGGEGSRQICMVFNDTTERKRAEEALRESEGRKAFLLTLSDALRSIGDAAEIQATTTRLLGEHLGADRVMYAEVEGESGKETGTIRGQYVRPAMDGKATVPFPQHFNFGQFGQHTMAARYRGEPLIVSDVENDPAYSAEERAAWGAYGVRAAIVAALAKDGRLVAEFGVHSTTARAWTDADVSLIGDVAERTWAAAERARAESALRESEERYRSLFESMDEAYAVVDVLKDASGKWADFRFVQVNPAFMEHTTMPYPVGKTATELLGTPNPRWTELYGQALDSGKPLRVEESERTLGLTFDLNIFSLDRAKNRVAVLFTNVTERKQSELALQGSERRARLLLAELQHRVRNTLAVVRSIARRTADRSDSVEDMLPHFEGRLNAFSRIQAAATRTFDGSVDLKSIVEDELVAVATREGANLKIRGPELCMKTRAAESISLAIHELATNAVKYGALASDDGRIDVHWKIIPNGEASKLDFVWKESGLKTPPRATHEGFGHEMLLRSLPYDLGAETNLEFGTDGMRFTMKLPMGPEILAEAAE